MKRGSTFFFFIVNFEHILVKASERLQTSLRHIGCAAAVFKQVTPLHFPCQAPLVEDFVLEYF